MPNLLQNNNNNKCTTCVEILSLNVACMVPHSCKKGIS